MTSHHRHRRTSNPATPFPTPLEPGEIAVNTANRQLAVGDASPGTVGSPLGLIAIRYFDPKAQYAVGDMVVEAGVIWYATVAVPPGPFVPASWKMIAGNLYSEYVLISGSTMTGMLTLAAEPTEDLHAATKAYADTKMPLEGGIFVGDITLPGPPTEPSDAANKEYVDTKLAIAGGTMTGTLVLAAEPASSLEAATKSYVDKLSGIYVSATPPVGAADNSIWWNSAEGQLFIYYFDGNSRAWVSVVPLPDLSSFIVKNGDVMVGQLKLTLQPESIADATRKDYVDLGIRTDVTQTFTDAQKNQAQQNLGAFALMKGYLYGLLMAYSSTTTFTVNPGSAIDSTGTSMLNLPAPMTKNTGAWTPGNNGGALNAGGIAANTTYHIFLIGRSDTGETDIMAAITIAPGLTEPWDRYRRIGSILTGASATWMGFTQSGDEFLLITRVGNFSGAATNAAVLHTLTVPKGLTVNALFSARLVFSTSGATYLITSPDESDQAPSGTVSSLSAAITGAIGEAHFNTRTNDVAQIRGRANAAGCTITFGTYGWIDQRGRDF